MLLKDFQDRIYRLHTIKNWEKEQAALFDKPVRSDRWRNLYFDKKGKSYTGLNIFASEAEALAVTLEIHTGGYTYVELLECVLPVSRLSHAIQMPVKE